MGAGVAGQADPAAPAGLGGHSVLYAIAHDRKAADSARVAAARSLVEAEREAAKAAEHAARAEAVASLATVPMPTRLMLLERIVRRDEAAGWTPLFSEDEEGHRGAAGPAGPAGVAVAEKGSARI